MDVGLKTQLDFSKTSALWDRGFLAAWCTHTHTPQQPPESWKGLFSKGKKSTSSSENIAEAFTALLWVTIAAKVCQGSGALPAPQNSQKRTAKPLLKALWKVVGKVRYSKLSFFQLPAPLACPLLTSEEAASSPSSVLGFVGRQQERSFC